MKNHEKKLKRLSEARKGEEKNYTIEMEDIDKVRLRNTSIPKNQRSKRKQ